MAVVVNPGLNQSNMELVIDSIYMFDAPKIMYYLSSLYKGDIICKCDSVWILESWFHIDVMRCNNYDVTKGLGLKWIARH